MSQVSLPMRIALAATLAFTALWLVALRPKPPATDPEPTPAPAAQNGNPADASSAPGKVVERAQQGVAKANGATAAREGATNAAGSDDATAAKPSTGAPATAAKKPAAPGPVDVEKATDAGTSKAAQAVLQDIAGGKVAVLLFWDRRLSDDQEVHRAVQNVNRHQGKVVVHVAPIAHLARYEPITRGVPVVTSPTVLIIDRAGHGRAVGGLTVTSELDELVGKALKVKP